MDKIEELLFDVESIRQELDDAELYYEDLAQIVMEIEDQDSDEYHEADHEAAMAYNEVVRLEWGLSNALEDLKVYKNGQH